ncbi:PDZ domain-containing protein [Haloferula sp.]|uniref:PDZ domain-containing protein n=1 Tax=Haloferula sp. TaxID=2497595 RepID=UPI003C73B8B9
MGAEAYPDRIAAEEALKSWAIDEGAVAKNWLLTQHAQTEDPEVRRRFMAVLKEVVMGELAEQRPGYVGIGMGVVELADGLGSGDYGVEIQAVKEEAPAAKAGLRVSDVIVSLDGKGWSTPNADEEFAKRIGAMHGGDKVRLEILRAGKKESIELVLAPRPWSLGRYGDRIPLQRDPFAAGVFQPPNEKDAQNQAFQAWMEQQKSPATGR